MTEEIDFSRVRITEEGRKLVEKYEEKHGKTNLKPCPFCGGKAKEWKEEGGYPWLFDKKVGCKKCGIDFYNDHNEGIEKWNRRVKE